MCTAVLVNNYFGRTLDLEYSYNEKIIFTPLNFNFTFKNVPEINIHPSIIGIGIIENNYPLYYDAMNEFGLCIAGLNFPISCKYNDVIDDNNTVNLAEFELIPYILSNAKNIKDAKNLIKNINITNQSFNDKFKSTHLHFIIADKASSIVLESTNKGIKLYDNPYNVLTNEPPFNKQIINITNNYFEDYSSQYRFNKIFKQKNLLKGNQYFDIFNLLECVNVSNGFVETKKGFQKTIYKACYDINNKMLYYNKYDNKDIKNIKLENFNTSNNNLVYIDI